MLRAIVGRRAMSVVRSLAPRAEQAVAGETAAVASPPPPPAAAAPKQSTIAQRFSAFLFGVGVTAITFSYFVRQDVQIATIEMRRVPHASVLRPFCFCFVPWSPSPLCVSFPVVFGWLLLSGCVLLVPESKGRVMVLR